MSCLKPSEVHPCPGLELCLKETWYCEDKKARCREGKTKQRMELVHARVQHFFVHIYFIFFILSSSRQANIFLQGTLRQWTAGPPEILFRTIPQKFQETSTATSEVLHWYKAEYGSQAVKSEVQYKPYVGIWNLERTLTNECMSDRNMRFWFDETHSGGSFSVRRSACIGNAHAQCSPCISIHDSTYPLATL